jgi:multiple sugar transport system substrate-binding protein
LGNATGDGNTWCQWLVWAFGGKLVDQNNKVVIDSPETVKALEYAKALYATFVPGTLSWLDPNNNKAFLDGQLSLTNNGISIYYATKNATDPKVKEMSADINHANMPDRPHRTAHRIPALLQPVDLQVHEVSESGQGVHSLHDGR